MPKDYKEFNMQVGNRLQLVRENLGYTQEAFAEILDVDSAHYRKIEKGKYGLSPEKMLILYRHYKIDPTYLITGEKKQAFDMEIFLANCDREERNRFLKRTLAYMEQLLTQTK